ncbi:MAG TPA: IPT/TIG domain-containing protein [Terriglobales bacterium]|nr:IPT/TIG domain-containing protein [Terriglobales bacterium]
MPTRSAGLVLLCAALIACGGGGAGGGGGANGGGAGGGGNGGGGQPNPNPKPAITSVSGVTLAFNAILPATISGSGFLSGSAVAIDNISVLPTQVSATQIELDLPASVQRVGDHTVTVFNPGPGGGTSNVGTLTVSNTVPSLQSISPPQATASDSELVLTLTGANFNTSTYVMFNGATSAGDLQYPVQVQTATQLQLRVPGFAAGTGGYLPVSVVNPGSGGGSSSALPFAMLSQAPVLDAQQTLYPLVRDGGNAPYALFGAGFNLSSAVRFDNVDVGVVSLGGVWGTEIGFTIPGTLLNSTGTFPLTVMNPAPGGGTATVEVDVVNPQPALASMTPAGAAAGAGALSVALTGSNFVPESVVYFNQQPLATTFDGATELTAQIPAALLAHDGVYPVSVDTPAPGGGVSQPLYFGGGAGGYAVAGAAMPGGTRTGFTSTLLADGRVLIAGGADAQGQATQSALLYDPRTASFSPTGNLQVARLLHTATLLPDGKVLIAGGMVQNGGTETAASFTAVSELYDPATGTFTATGSLGQARAGAMATLLPSGDVLVAGGFTLGTTGTAGSELYDEASGAFATGPGMSTDQLGRARENLLPTGKVLVSSPNGGYEADLYEPQQNAFAATGSQDEIQFLAPTAPLPNGDVVVAGGFTDYGQPVTYSNAERYQTALGLWEDVNPLQQPLFAESATLLPDGQVLFAGGSGFDALDGFLSADELFDPSLNQFRYTGGLPGTLLGHSATLLQDGTVLLVGGMGTASGAAVLFAPPPPAAPFTPTLAAAALKALPSGTWAIVRGNPFFPGVTVSLDGTAVPSIYLDTTLVSFELPSGVSAGTHTVTVANPGGQASAALSIDVP